MKYTLILAALAATASAHVHMASPPPLRAKENPNVVKVDDSINAPLNPDGSNFPCKGYHLDAAEMGSVADFAPGSSQKVIFAEGGAGHAGGSCQVSISVDGGNTFKVIRSFMGGCPVISDGNGGQSPSPGLDFTIPKDTPAGPALLSWSWNNRIGNREFYQNCASVTVTSEGAGSETIPFDQRPDMFTANLGKGCTTAESIDVEYPDPGPDPIIHPSAKLGDPTGGETCGKAISGGAPKIPGAQDGAKEVVPGGSPATSTLAAPAADNSGTPNSGASKPAVPVPDTTLALDPTELGRCGLIDGTSYTCKGSQHGPSCSSFGYCGKTAEHSGPGCQTQFGACSGTAGIGTFSAKSHVVESPATSVQSTASSFLDEQSSSAASSASSPSKTDAGSTTSSSTAANTETATSPIRPSEHKAASLTATVGPVPSQDASTPTTGLDIHPDGKCGSLLEGKFTCVGSGRGCACSSAGWCGNSPAHFGQGCQPAFGTCGDEAALCKVTIQSDSPGNSTADATKSVGKVAATSLVLTTVPVLTVTVTETAAAASDTMNTVAVPTTLETQTKPATASEVKSQASSEAEATAAATIVPRFKRPAGSFLDFLDGSKSVGEIGAKGPKPTLGGPFSAGR